jgi:hypothetical protein
MRSRYYTYDKDYAKRSLDGCMVALQEIVSQEFDSILDNDQMEFEDGNKISFPPQHIVLMETLKKMKQVIKLIDEDAYASLIRQQQ